MAITRKPNTVCSTCGKEFYACRTCLRKESWKAYACSIECWEAYQQAIIESRKPKSAPERLDMTVEEIAEVMSTPVEEVVEYTKNVELADYVQENPTMTIEQIVDVVNEDIEASNTENVETPVVEEFVPKKKKKKSWYSDIMSE